MIAKINKIEVWMNQRIVGHMGLTPDALCAFEYHSDWLCNGFSISPFELPLTPGVKIAKRRPFDGGFGVFDDCLPDGWGRLILYRYLFTLDVKAHELDYLQLLCIVGSNGRGALQFRPDRTITSTTKYSTFTRLAAEAEAILSSDTYTGKYLQEMIERGGSPGGARPKIFIHDETGEWLVKFRAKYDPQDIGHTELQYAHVAIQCGIEMMPCKLFEGQYFGTMRYDRQHGNRQHVISAAGLLGADYREPSIDYRHIFQLVATLTHSMAELWRAYRLMCFNVLIGNKDDHAKNFAFIYEDGWHLSPAYDLLPSNGFNGYHTTSVNDNITPKKEDLLALAKAFGLDSKKAEIEYEQIRNIVRACGTTV